MDYGELVDQVILHTGRSDKRSLIESLINLNLNAIVRDASAQDHNFECLSTESHMTCVVGNPTVSLPADVQSITNLCLLDNSMWSPLTFVFERRFDTLYKGLYLGKPTVYTQSGMTLRLYRIPDNEYTLRLRYHKWHPPLISFEDVPLFVQMDDVIIEKTVSDVYFSLGLYDQGRMWYQKYVGSLRSAIRSEGKHEDWIKVTRPFKVFKPKQEINVPFS